MPPKDNLLIRFIWKLHLWIYMWSGGRLGARLLDMPVLLLYTVGRRTQRRRVNAISYRRDGVNFVIAASNGGADVHPGWRFNLLAEPHAQIQIGKIMLSVLAREEKGDERRRLWEDFKNMEAAYQRYEKKTDRLIPIIILEPVKDKSP
ncbi:MAG: nitroreductase family deazaflavin-dependent oxidoreductase [Chloroflexi bacterium]|nr:nitroreductase family deazaflavin-dependent oxidoreductase [Chloroflexota bacterium]MQC26043.1 nitroreductase family deazaflavin-dependent oxidoreductase [Chloroflexota bacterium]